ncbi:MAG: tRNA 2-selenouridine(34) synthase MnmH [Bacteroidales bacterium]|nr:tRNA 2-selenouridine(34) synthase MnmH [Bacteroidales bacterium]MBN2750023.1 tRNA 2-selenouridine(34) synthase MnmH [Bacteroidales bacterium]
MPAKNKAIDIETFLSKSQHTPIIDVRSPSEFKRGHIPGAINIPIFNDDERAAVGTTYVQKGRDLAVEQGLGYVGPNLVRFVKMAKEKAPNNELLVHCWRGGMRSASMAWLFNTADISTYTLVGGYKSYRNYVLKSFDADFKFVILGGMTGSGKTAILKEIENQGQQVIDLEGIANHKGSAFGALGQQPQPTTEHFENILYTQLSKLDTSKHIWLEDESKAIGGVFIPDAFFAQMRQSLVMAIERPKEVRVRRLVEEYAFFNPEELSAAVNRISKRLGGDNTKECLESIESGNIARAIEISLSYYDKTYTYGLSNRTQKPYQIELGDDNPSHDAATIIGKAWDILEGKEKS